MLIGFTGSRKGMSDVQADRVETALRRALNRHGLVEAVHGDCVGSDAQFDALCKKLGIRVSIRPCTITSQRAGCDSPTIAEPKAPLDRNDDIARLSDLLIATPCDSDEQLRSGTWSTVRRARKYRTPIFVVFPNGVVRYEV